MDERTSHTCEFCQSSPQGATPGSTTTCYLGWACSVFTSSLPRRFFRRTKTMAIIVNDMTSSKDWRAIMWNCRCHLIVGTTCAHVPSFGVCIPCRNFGLFLHANAPPVRMPHLSLQCPVYPIVIRRRNQDLFEQQSGDNSGCIPRGPRQSSSIVSKYAFTGWND